jgi:hypothetical protein
MKTHNNVRFGLDQAQKEKRRRRVAAFRTIAYLFLYQKAKRLDDIQKIQRDKSGVPASYRPN